MENQESMSEKIARLQKMLYVEFPPEAEKVVPVSGVDFVFIPVSEVINRLNDVIISNGGKWSWELISAERDALDPDEIITHGKLTIDFGDGNPIVRHALGGTTIKRSKKDNKPVDLGNSFKTAESDALKKAAQRFGVGLYLSRSIEAIEAGEAMYADQNGGPEPQIAPAKQQPAELSEIEQKWQAFVDITKKLTKEQKDELNEFWKNQSGDRPKPTKSNVTEADMSILMPEALRLAFGGQYVETNS